MCFILLIDKSMIKHIQYVKNIFIHFYVLEMETLMVYFKLSSFFRITAATYYFDMIALF